MSWDPSSLTGLLGWWKADAGLTLSGSNVTAWADSSGNGHALASSVGNPTSTLTLNSLPVVSFASGSNQALATTFALGVATTSMFGVVRYNPGTDFDRFCNYEATGQSGDFNNSTSAVYALCISSTRIEAFSNSVDLSGATTMPNTW